MKYQKTLPLSHFKIEHLASARYFFNVLHGNLASQDAVKS